MSGIYFDSANLDELKEWFNTGILGGATTNPVILQKEGILDIPKHITEMIKIVGGGFPISIELPDSEMFMDEMIDLGKQYDCLFPYNAVIKVPIDPRRPQKLLGVVKELVKNRVSVNATLGLTTGQLIGAMEAGADYVSLFWGRCDEAKGLGAEETLKTVLRYREVHKLKSKIIIGSIRSVKQIDKAFSLGADIVTIPPKLISDWMFTERGVETADEFNKAYRDVMDKIVLV